MGASGRIVNYKFAKLGKKVAEETRPKRTADPGEDGRGSSGEGDGLERPSVNEYNLTWNPYF